MSIIVYETKFNYDIVRVRAKEKYYKSEKVLENGYNANNNFKSKNILGTLLDSENNIWISTANGVYLLMNDNPFERDHLETFHYSDAEGVIDLESNLNALFEDSEGNIKKAINEITQEFPEFNFV